MKIFRHFLSTALCICAIGLTWAAPSLQAQGTAGAQGGRLSAGDTIDIRVFRHDDLGGKLTLGADGTVGLQFVGPVNLQGLTPEQARQKIESLLSDGWLRKPQVTVNITDFAKNFITVDGQVNRPNGFSVARNKPFTIAQAIGMAGGFNTRANKKAVILKRGNKTFTINVKAIYEDPSQDMPLQDGDVLLVPQAVL